jgi:hypothetical protein
LVKDVLPSGTAVIDLEDTPTVMVHFQGKRILLTRPRNLLNGEVQVGKAVDRFHAHVILAVWPEGVCTVDKNITHPCNETSSTSTE